MGILCNSDLYFVCVLLKSSGSSSPKSQNNDTFIRPLEALHSMITLDPTQKRIKMVANKCKESFRMYQDHK